MYWGSRVRTKFYGSIIDFGSERVFLSLKYKYNNFNEQLSWTFFNLEIYAHLCGYLLTSVYPFIILYALFFIKPKNCWLRTSWQKFATLIPKNTRTCLAKINNLTKGGNYKL